VFSGRTAIFHGLRVLGIAPGERVLVPAFNCASLVEPIRRYGAKAAFYKIDADCSADFDDIERRIDSTTRAIVVIHYFGFPERLERFRELCARRGVYLIEDCAHVLTGAAGAIPLGATGDVSIFSWRKFLPVGDGGQLVINTGSSSRQTPSPAAPIFSGGSPRSPDVGPRRRRRRRRRNRPRRARRRPMSSTWAVRSRS
jgi:dTDP-4-amino-4,6-dideoxygalactose transaminase